MQLSIIIVSYNTRKLTIEAIESVIENIKSSRSFKDNVEIIIVDNNSTDNSVKSISTLLNKPSNKKIFSSQLIVNSTNLGFAKANNIGIKKSSGEYILLLNSDTIVKPKSLEKLFLTFKKSIDKETTAYNQSSKGELDKLGILSANLLNQDGTIQAQGGSFPTILALFFHMTFLDDVPFLGKLLPSTQHTGKNTKLSNSCSLVQQDWVGGTAMMVKRAVFDEIGLLDEKIFMYGEDIEFCMRAKNHHWDVAIHPNAYITHLGSASSSSENAIIGEFKGYIYIWSKHKPLWQISLAKAVLKIGALSRIILFSTLVKNPIKASIYKKALKVI